MKHCEEKGADWGERVTIKSHLIWSLVFDPMPRKMTLYPSWMGGEGRQVAGSSVELETWYY